VTVRQERDLSVHVLYVAAPDFARFLKSSLRRPAVLIVTDARDGLENGATINFVLSEGRVKFEVSLEAAQRAGLTISARLLGIAVRVKKGEFQHSIYALIERVRVAIEPAPQRSATPGGSPPPVPSVTRPQRLTQLFF
jgi:hypothetical protein